MKKIATTPEESKEIINMGIDVRTADMYYHPFDNYSKPYINLEYPPVGLPVDYEYAWSASALLDIIPDILPHQDFNEYRVLLIRKVGDTGYYLSYEDEDACDSFPEVDLPTRECLVDACIDMIRFLNENNLLL